MSEQRPLVTIITPAYNEEENLEEFYRRLRSVLDGSEVDWEWIVLDDHSTDGTFKVVRGLALRDDRVRGFRFSRNFGAHAAAACGLSHALGSCSIVMAADLQDPPEEIPRLLEEWRGGAQVVWAVRSKREGENPVSLIFARLFHSLMRRLGEGANMPATGADSFLLDRRVIDVIEQFGERHFNIVSLIKWMGFRQAIISYTKRARVRGSSGWTLKKKLKLAVDTVTSFSYFPIRVMSYVGIVIALLGFLYALLVIFNAFLGNPVQGWSSLMIVLLVVSGLQMLLMGVLGEYLWRSLDESRRRPRYLVEEEIGRGASSEE